MPLPDLRSTPTRLLGRAVRLVPPPYREIVRWWLVSRLVVVGGALLLSAWASRIGYFGRPTLASPLGVLASWDGRWYAMVARRGYLLIPGRQSDPAFFPLYPVLLRAGHLVGLGLKTWGVVLSNLTLPFALCALYALGRRVVKEPVARRGAVYAAIFPMGFVFSMAYPQSLALLAILAAALLAQDERFFLAALAAAAATLLRPEGLFVALPIAVVVARRWRGLRPGARGRGIAAAAAAPLALCSYPLYLGWTIGNPNAWGQAQQAWGRSFALTGVLHAAAALPATLELHPVLGRDAAAVVVYAILLAAAARAQVPSVWLVAAALALLIPLTSGAVDSEARFGLLAPAVYWGLAGIARTPVRDLSVRVVSLCLLAAATLTVPYVFP